MEFKKCERCGSFFAGINNICNHCIEKENLDLSRLKNYFEEVNEENAEGLDNIDNISYATGITSKNLTRHLQSQEIIFKDLDTKL